MQIIRYPYPEVCGSYGRVYFEEEIPCVYKTASCLTQCSLQLPHCLLAQYYTSLESPFIKQSVKHDPTVVAQSMRKIYRCNVFKSFHGSK